MSDLEKTIRKIVREEIERAIPKTYYGYHPLPLQPNQSASACSVCGLSFGLGPMGYVCGNAACPNKVTCA